MIEIDERHKKEMDALACIAKCRECDSQGLAKNSSILSGRHRLLRYRCGNCGKVYSENQLTDLINGDPAKPVITKAQTKPRTVSEVKEIKRGSIDIVEKAIIDHREELAAIEDFSFMLQKICEYAGNEYESIQIKPDKKITCPGCGKTLQKAGFEKGRQRYRCNTKNCEFYHSRKFANEFNKVKDNKGDREK